MSWQCPICETVNQDVTPVCTVCDTLAPVIESYLSLEAIDRLREYNEKLDAVHTFEADSKYQAMFDMAMEAVALYKENRIALDKAKQALIYLIKEELKTKISIILKNAIEEKNYLVASAMFELIDVLSIDTFEFTDVRVEVKNQISYKNDIVKILDESYKAIIELDTSRAMNIIEDGISKYSSSELLRLRREDIKNLIGSLSSIRKREEKRKPYPRSPQKRIEPISTPVEDDPIIDLTPKKRIFPKKIKRKTT